MKKREWRRIKRNHPDDADEWSDLLFSYFGPLRTWRDVPAEAFHTWRENEQMRAMARERLGDLA